ncbi:MAG: peptide chain release factor N(5)-glutamine methyltransferase [Clostridiales bacterium]|nr:peptide chain release factor N(5)-glutamine methyltransferase [Clostridiales bacterium]
MSTYREILTTARNYLKQHAIADADVDAWYLLAHVFGISRAEFYLHTEDEVSGTQAKAYMELIRQRAKHIPLQLITGKQEFMGLEFEVSSDVLIPRQDTEVLVEEALKVCNQKSVLDMCTGSGCIIISLAKLSNLTKAVGVDISEKALKVARKNAAKHKQNVEFIQSNLFDNIKGEYDVVVSNPPYIPTEDIKNLMPEVRDHEPIMALDGDQDGLSFYRRIALQVKNHLNPNGYIMMEIGYNQGKEVVDILQKAGFYDVKIIKDLSGMDRVVSGRYMS